MADSLPEQKEGGDDGNPNTVVPQKDELSGLQCAPSGVCNEDPHQNEELTLHSTKLQEDESRSVGLHPAEAKAAKYSEETADNSGRPVVKDGSETAETFKKQSDETGRGPDESKLAKTTVSQAKDPPDRENSPAEGKMVVTEQNEAPPSEGASREILPVSTKSSETPIALNDNTSDHKPPCTPALPQTIFTENVFEKSGIPTETYNCSAVGCQESLKSSSNPTSLPSEKPPDSDLDSSSNVSGAPQQEKLTEALTESQDSSKSSIYSASSETAVIESSSTQSSSICSASDLCPASEVVHNVVDTPSQSSGSASASKSSSTPTQISSAQEESGNEVGMLVNQSQIKETESNSQTSKAQCPQGYVSAENKNQDQISSEKNDTVMEGEKIYAASEEPGNPRSLTGQSKMQVEQKESWNEVTNEMGTETLPLIVATHSLSQEQDAEKQSTGKGEPTALVSTEMEATKKKIIPSLESEPLKPVTIGSSLQPLEEIQEASVVEDTSFTTDMAIIDSSADEADSIGGLVINNVIGAADGVADFHPEEVETEKELTDISASAPQLGEGSESSDEHGPSAKRRRLENGPNSVEDKSNSAKKVILKVIPVQNGHGVWDSQKLQEVLLTKGTILLQIHASKESIELFEPDKSDKKVDFTAIMAETKDDDHDHMLSFGNVDPECDDPLAVGASHPETTSLPSYGAPYSHSHSRSTALQPAMSRPGFKHLQTPQQYHMKNEVLGLPPPLEFEEPQMGSPDWSGFGLNTKSKQQQISLLTFGNIPSQVQRVKEGGHSVKVTKVCEVCGATLHTPADFAKHQQCGWLNCGKCHFQAKNVETFIMHVKLHQRKYAEQKCNLCHETFSSPITQAVHKRKIHGVYDCRHCFSEFSSRSEWSDHVKLNHKNETKKNLNFNQSQNEDPCFSKKLLVQDVPMLIPSPSPGLIISRTQSVSSSSAVYNPQLYTRRNPIRRQSLPLVEEKITCKDEPLETENITPETILIKVNTKRKRRYTLPPKLIGLPCESCNAAFKTLTALRNHVKQKHTARPKCPACNLTRSTSRKVFQHQITAHKEKLRCRHYCLALFDTREELSAHHINVHNKDDTVMKCRYCQTNYPKGTYLEHLQECPGNNKCKRIKTCTSCDRKFIDPTEYSHHVKICQPSTAKTDSEIESPTTSTSLEKKPIMQDQEEQQSNTKQLEIHQVLENRQNLETIEKSCGASATVNSEMVNSSKHETTHLKCRFCPKVFKNEEDGVDHMINQHKTVFSYMKEYKVCDICGKLFISGLSLCKHLVKHHEKCGMWHKLLPANFGVDDIKVRCWICKTSGVSYSTFHTNARYSILEKLLSSEACKSSDIYKSDTFRCCLCEVTFSEAHRYWSHIKIHLSKAPFGNVERNKYFSCPRCPQKYSIKSQLLEHLAQHLIEQNILEDRKGNLKSNNTLVDTDDKMDKDLIEGESDDTELKADTSVNKGETFKCLHCKQVFSIKSDALKHLHSSHRKELKEMASGKACHLCDKSFIKPSALCSHILKHYINLGMWENLVPRDLLSKVDKQYCWICNTVFKAKYSGHEMKRNDSIEKALSSRSEELEEDEQFQCPLCEFSCSDRYDHWKHIKLHLYLNRNYLGKTDVDSEVEHSTISADSEHKRFDCLKCNKRFFEMSDFRKHLATHFLRPCKIKKRKRDENVQDVIPFPKKIKTMTLRSKSLKLGHGNIRCALCFSTFRNSDDAVSHVISAHKFKMTHGREQDLTCKMCGTNFKSEWWLCRHIVNHYNNLQMWDALVPRDLVNALNTRNQCWICKCVLDRNYVAHTNKRNTYIGVLLAENCKEEESKFDCSLCSQEFSTRIDYWQHITLHMCKPPSEFTSQNDPKPMDRKKDYECNECSLHFQDEDELYKHLAFHFLECSDEEKSGTSVMVEEHLSEDTMQTEESSEDEWLPPSTVKKKITDFKKQADDEESNNRKIETEDNKNLVHDSEAICDVSFIKTEDTGSIYVDEM